MTINIANKDIRDGFFDTLYEIGRNDRDVIILTDDLDVFSLRKFKKECPKQFINIGVAEQNMVNVAAGLSSAGKKVFIYGIATFVTFRCYEQIRFNICSMKLPVVIVGIGCGLSFSFDGPTHHGIHDVSVMRTLPGMSVFSPCDSISASACAQLVHENGPAFVRIDKGIVDPIYDDHDEVKPGFKVVRPISKINFITTGYMTHQAIRVADLLGEHDIGIIDICRIKPINPAILELISGTHSVCLEENSTIGGLNNAISDLLIDYNVYNVKFSRIGLSDSDQFLKYGSREWLHDLYNVSVEKIAEKVKDIWKIHP